MEKIKMYKANEITTSDQRKADHITTIFDKINELFEIDSEFASNFKTNKTLELLLRVSEKTLEHEARFIDVTINKYKEALIKKQQKQMEK